MSSYTGVFGDYTVTPSSTGFLSLTIANNYTLFWPSPGNNIPSGSTTQATVSAFNNIIATATSLNVSLPDATKVSEGTAIVFTNVGGGGNHAFNVVKYDNTLLINIAVGSSFLIYLTDNSTQAGSFTIVPYAGGESVVTSLGLAVAGANNGNIVVSSNAGNPINSAGTFTLTLANDLLAIVGFGVETGYAARTAANTWALRTFTATANQIVLTNPGGVAAPTNFALASDIEDITSISLEAGLTLEANTIVGANTGNVELTPVSPYCVEITRGGIEIDGNVGTNTTNPIKFFNAGDDFYTSLQAPVSLTKNIIYVMPEDEPEVTQVLNVQNVVNSPIDTFTCTLQWATIPTSPGSSTLHAIARYSNAIGSIENSGILISNTNAITGATSLTLSTDNLITTNTGALFLDPNASSPVNITGISYPLHSDSGNIESCVLTANGDDELIFSANVNDNLLINGAFDIWQRNTSITSATPFFNNNSQSYTADCWYLESQINNVVNSQKFARTFAGVACSGDNVYRFTIQQTANKFALFQFVDNITTAKLINQVVSFSFACAASAGTSIRASLLSWNGAADTLTKPVVSTWNAPGTNPTLNVAGWEYVGGDPSGVIITTSLVRQKYENITVPADATNLAVIIWYDQATAANASTLDIGAVKLEQGPSCTAFYPRPFETEMILCKQRFGKDLPIGTNVGTATTVSSDMFFPIIGAFPIPDVGTSAFTSKYAQLLFDVEMRTTPTVVFYSYTAATANIASNYNATFTDLAANSAIAANINSKGCQIQNQSGGTLAIGTANFNEIVAHHYRSADL